MIGEAIAALEHLFGLENRCYLIDTSRIIVEFDSVDSETWTGNVTPDSNPREKGKKTIDSIFVEPYSVSLKATLTNHTGISILNPLSLLRVRGLNEVENKIEEKLNKLEAWRSEGILLTYMGAVKEDPFENCIIQSLSPGKQAGGGEAVDVSITLKKIESGVSVTIKSSLPVSAKATTVKGQAITGKQVVSVLSKNKAVLHMLK